jgi:diguanylate cyclase (GGDEF)-like protein
LIQSTIGDISARKPGSAAAVKILGSHTFRKEDVVSRIGGDEFVILLPGVDLNQNKTFFNRLENGISKYNNSKIDDGLYRPISISFGYAVVNQGESLEEGYKKS